MNSSVFYFDFWHSDAEKSTVYAFNLTLLNDDLNEDLDSNYEDHCANTESDYGVHDWGSRPHEFLSGFGYSSYEVEPENYLKVMELWREYFMSRSDVQDVTEVVEIPAAEFEDMDDLKVRDFVYFKLIEKNDIIYFAVANSGIPIEVDRDLARSLYRATCCDDTGKPEQNVWPRADVLFEAGEKVYPSKGDENSYIFGTSLTKKERFKMALTDGIQTTEEFRADKKRGC